MVDSALRTGDGNLLGRAAECLALEQLVEAVRRGEGGALVVRGEAGIGKTALLDYMVRQWSSVRVIRAVGVELETELAFAVLHQLCAPLLDVLKRIPSPQRSALEIVFGMSEGPPPDRFLVGLGALSLLCEAAAERPVVCVVDDAQWLDRASAQTLAFVARRLMADPVGIVFATRAPGEELRGLPEIELHGLRNGDARALLGSAVRFVLDERIRDRVVAETGGNPLALLELPHGMSASQLAGGFGLLAAQVLSERIEASFGQRLLTLPEQTRQLLLVAAVEPVGDPVVMWAAAGRLGIGRSAVSAAEASGLLEVGARVTFRHPLARSAVYRSASPDERRQAHSALARVTSAEFDPDRRAWHLAEAAAGPEEDVALELERSAERAQARGGLAAAAAFLQRSVEMTRDPARRADRALAAARANMYAGAFDAAHSLLLEAQAGQLDERQCAHIDLLRAQIAFASGYGRDAPGLLLAAAQRLQPLDVRLARETYLEAWSAAVVAGPLAADTTLREISEVIRSVPRPVGPTRLCDQLLDAFAVLMIDGPTRAAPMLRRAAQAFADPELPEADGLRWGWVAEMAATELWDDASWHAISVRQVALAREAGALDRLPIGLNASSMLVARSGRFPEARALIAEADAIVDITRTGIAPFGAMLLGALQGREPEVSALVDAIIADATAGGQGVAVQFAHWVSAVLANGLQQYAKAVAHAQLASDDTPELYVSAWALPELIEAAALSGEAELAAGSVERLAVTTRAGGSEWALGVEARSRALVATGDTAQALYRESIDRLERSMIRCDLARAHLLYGEWLRGQGEGTAARVELRRAYDMLAAIGMEGFAERARVQLEATGEKVGRHADEPRDELTDQERQIALLAHDGLTNPEIGARLFLSPRTVEWHLRKVFSKLGIRSRRELAGVLPGNRPIPLTDPI